VGSNIRTLRLFGPPVVTIEDWNRSVVRETPVPLANGDIRELCVRLLASRHRTTWHLCQLAESGSPAFPPPGSSVGTKRSFPSPGTRSCRDGPARLSRAAPGRSCVPWRGWSRARLTRCRRPPKRTGCTIAPRLACTTCRQRRRRRLGCAPRRKVARITLAGLSGIGVQPGRQDGQAEVPSVWTHVSNR